jgi:alpha-1,3-rhamnosyltransferase
MSNTLVTVGIALYNHEKYIKECLESIINQTYDNLEIIVIDDGSKDSSYNIAKEVLESQTRRKYILKTRPNIGMCNTLNEIIELASGEYISFIGSDDFWHKDKIKKQAKYLDEHPDIALVHCNSYLVDGDSKVYGEFDCSSSKTEGDLFHGLIMGSAVINTPGNFYRTSVYEKIGKYDPQFRWEDDDFWQRLTKIYKVGFINEFLTYYRRHGENLSKDDNVLEFINDEVIRIYHKNIDDPDLLKKAVAKMYRKSLLRALRKAKMSYILKYLPKYIGCRYLGKC